MKTTRAVAYFEMDKAGKMSDFIKNGNLSVSSIHIENKGGCIVMHYDAVLPLVKDTMETGWCDGNRLV